MKYFARIGERLLECRIEEQNGQLVVETEGQRYRADLQHLPRARSYSLLLDGRSYEFTLHESDEAIECSGAAGLFHVQVEDARTHAARSKTADARAAGGVRQVKAAMPGIVREVMVEVGETVEKSQALLILEAMKMQNEIRSDRAGTVRALHIAAGDTVEKNQKLVELE
ncbi:MAG: acyl-CoA carboxylase biotin carboxyl carrier protein subunit [Planctomycetota bacterium]|jgi:biotin carboxyl carrier protein